MGPRNLQFSIDMVCNGATLADDPELACRPSDGPTACAVLFGQFTQISPWCGCTALVNNLNQAHNGQPFFRTSPRMGHLHMLQYLAN
jgi:hypothetical protein